MKLTARSFENSLGSFSTPYLLLHGEDEGGVHLSWRRLVAIHGPAETLEVGALLSDPGLPARILSATGLFSTIRLVRIDVADKDRIATIADALEAQAPRQGLCVFVGGELDGRATLRKWAEKSAYVGVLAHSYPDPDVVVEEARRALPASVARGVVEATAARLPRDSAARARELEKLVSYLEAGGAPEALCDVVAGDTTDEVDALVTCTLGGDVRGAAEAWDRFATREDSFMLALRSLSWRFVRARQVREAMDAGESFDSAAKGLRPPMFFTQREETRGLCALGAPVLDSLLDRLGECETRAKRTGMPADALVARCVFEIASAVAAGRRGRHG